MLATRAPLLWAFAGGCLSGAGLICFWGGDAGTLAGSNARDERPTPADVFRIEPAAGVESAARAEKLEERRVSPEPGTSIADVLTRLEAAYRRELATAGPSSVDAKRDSAHASTQAESQPMASAPRAAADHQPPAREDTTQALSNLPVASAPVASVPEASAPVASVPVAGAPVASAPVSNGNVHVGNVHQGDVYQLAVVQYFQMLALSSQAGLMPPAGTQHPGTAQRAPSLPSPRARTSPGGPFSNASLTRPADGFPFKDYPWGSVTPASALVR